MMVIMMEIDGEERKRDSNGWRRGRAMNGDGEEKERERERVTGGEEEEPRTALLLLCSGFGQEGAKEHR